tara:strand:+ start:86 stop:529 length:444 start_codon:yes stop_codon:yes gene_type:complete
MTELATILSEKTIEPSEKLAGVIQRGSKNLGSVGLAVVYTVGHIFIAIACASYIFNAPLNLAAIDAFIEPIINGFWFYLLHQYFKNKLSNIVITVIYTVGHICVATLCAALIFNAPLNLAAIDAFVEPIINGFWFYALHSYWKRNNS